MPTHQQPHHLHTARSYTHTLSTATLPPVATPTRYQKVAASCDFLANPLNQCGIAHICNDTAPAAPPPAHCMLIHTHTVHHSPSTSCHTNLLPKSRSQLRLFRHPSQPVRYCSASTDVEACGRSSTRGHRCAAPASYISCG
jgi:hypothetical protein